MPNPFIDHKNHWLALSEIDYLGQFVKAWLAFNAWYRNAYNEPQDRKIINAINWEPNPVLSKLRPMLARTSEEASQFRAEIGLLHHRLENYELHAGKSDEKERITLRNVYLKDSPPAIKTEDCDGCDLKVERNAGGNVTTNVTRRRSGRVLVTFQQNKFDLNELEFQPQFQNDLNVRLQSALRQLYKTAGPKHYANLMVGIEVKIKCGAYDFPCGAESLFAGVVEAVYLMRNTLFHGELVPTKEAAECYEPAYRIVRRFLVSVG